MIASKIWLGASAAILAGAFWGLVFLAPELARGFQPMQLSAGRYLAYGLVAALLIAPSWRRLVGALTWKEWRALVWLGFTGNIIYYVFLAEAVQSGGVAMTSIVIGLLPLTVTLVGSRDRHAVPVRRLLPSLVLSMAGLVCIGWQSLSEPGAAEHGSVSGLLCAVGALAAWTIYAVSNSRWLARLHHVSAHEWSLLTGVVTGVQAVVLAVPAFHFMPARHALPEWLMFAGVVTAVAIFCSVVGNGLWNRAARLLPLTLVGQMIVFETLFALLYGFLWEARWPTGLEYAAMLLLVTGVLSCAAAHRPQPA